MRCPACDQDDLSEFFCLEQVPVFCNVLWPSREDARAAARADIRLGHCRACGLVHNVAFDPALVEYSPAYENALHFSATFRRYAEELAQRLTQRYDLHGKDIIEIGCGDGNFLATLCRNGTNRGVGFDPGFNPRNAPGAAGQTVTILPEAYSTAHAHYPADLICCRHVLEHVARPLDFLIQVRRAIGDRMDTPVFFEVPNTLEKLEDLGVWDLIYEHCSYFVAASLRALFVRAGFAPTEVSQAYEGQFLTIEARPAAGGEGGPSPAEPDAEAARIAERLEKVYRDKVDSWQGTLSQLRRRRSRVVAWGGGSKGVTFLNVLGIGDDLVARVVDVNPRKTGRFIPGTAQQIVQPDFLREHRPDVVIVINPIYRQEIADALGQMGVHAELLTA